METLRVDPRIRAASPAKLGEDGFDETLAREVPGTGKQAEGRRCDDRSREPDGRSLLALKPGREAEQGFRSGFPDPLPPLGSGHRVFPSAGPW